VFRSAVELAIRIDKSETVLVPKILIEPQDPEVGALVVIGIVNIHELSHRLIVAHQQPDIGLLRQLPRQPQSELRIDDPAREIKVHRGSEEICILLKKWTLLGKEN